MRGALRAAIENAGYSVSVETIRLGVEGMHCGACVGSVESALAGVPGVLRASVSLPGESARIEILSGAVSQRALAAALAARGYGADVLEGAVSQRALEARRSEAREARAEALFRKFRLGAVLSLPVLVVGHHEIFPLLRGLPPGTVRLLWVLSGLLTLWIAVGVGRQFYLGAWRAARNREANMDTLVAVGTGAALLYSLAAVAAPGLFPEGAAHPFFEAAAVVITLVVLGQALEARARGTTSKALRALMDLRPRTARVLREGEEVEIRAAEVEPGDLLVVRPGSRSPWTGASSREEAPWRSRWSRGRASRSRRRRVTRWSAGRSTAPVASGCGRCVSAGTRSSRRSSNSSGRPRPRSPRSSGSSIGSRASSSPWS